MNRVRISSIKRIVSIVTAAAMISVSICLPVHAEEMQITDEALIEDETVTSAEGNELSDAEAVHSQTADSETSDSDSADEKETESSPPDLLDAAGFSELDDDHALSRDQVISKQTLSEHASEAYDGIEGVDYAANEIVVEASDEDEARAYAQAYNAELVDYEYGNALLRLDPDGRDEEKLQEIMDQDIVTPVDDVVEADMVSLAVAVSADPDINLPAAWPNYYDELLTSEYDYSEFDNFGCEYNDPLLPQVGRDDDGSYNYQWHHDIIGSNAAWRAGYTGKDVKVVIIDSGVNAHEDINVKESCRILDSGDIDNVTADSSDHGTSVAGIIGAVAGNGLGGAGVAPECEMYMIRVTGDSGSISRYAETIAIGRAIEVYGADVINISIGGTNYTEYLASTIDYAYKSGVAVVCAAGNDGISADIYPASHPGAISVAASDISNERTVISNYGLAVRYGAPGDNVCAPSGSGDTYSDNNDGTSFAAPVITGMIADIISSGKVSGVGKARVDNILKMLDKSCTNATAGMGRGIPDLATALGLDTNNATPLCPVADKTSGAYVAEEITVALTTGNSGATHKDIIFYSTDGGNVSYTSGRPSANAIKYDDSVEITIGGKRATTIKAIAVNPSNGLVSKQVTYTYTLKPLVSSIDFATATGTYTMRAGTSVGLVANPLPAYAANRQVTYTVTDYPDDSPVNTRLYVRSGTLYAPAKAWPGEYEITCTAKDAGQKSVSLIVTVISPVKKVYQITSPQTSLVVYSGSDKNMEITLKVKEGGAVTRESAQEYSTWSTSGASVATAAIDDNTLTISAHKAGTATITGYSNDGTNKSCRIKVTVRQHPESVSINPVIGNKVGVGKSVKLTAGVLPSDTYNKGIKWSITQTPGEATSRPGATINSSNGMFSTSARTVCGTYTVRATCKDTNNDASEVYDEYDIEVYADLTKKITVDNSKVTIFRRKNAYNCATEESVGITLTGGSFDTLSVSNNNPGIADAALSEDDEGNIKLNVYATANGTGTARITVKANDGTEKSATVSVTVANPPSYLEIGRPSGVGSNLAKGKSVKLTAKFGTLYGKLTSASQKLEWSSNHPEYVSVNGSGTITAKSNEGKSATITARTVDGSNVVSSITITSVAATTGITTDGLWRRMKRSSTGEIFGEYISSIEPGHTGYLSLDNVTNVAGGVASPMNSNYVDISVNKSGLPVKWTSATREAGMPNSTIALYANEKGTYYVTVKMRDKSSASKKIKIVVK